MSKKASVKLDYKKALKWPLIRSNQVAKAAKIITAGTRIQLEAVKSMEEKFADWVGSRYALSSNNGTSAIFSALYALGIEPGSEVLVPSFTFWASVMPILWAGLVPVFCDIDPETLCVSIDDIKKKYSPRTKALLIVHLFGQVADMGKILEFARQQDLKVIEDASQSIGAAYGNSKLGTLGDVGCFSLQTSKHIPAGEGGILITQDRHIYERAICLGHYRRIPHLGNRALINLKNTGLGFKFRIHPFAARICEELLDSVDHRLSQIHKTMDRIAAALEELPCFSIPKVVSAGKRTYWTRFHVVYKPELLKGISKSRLIRILNNAGVLIFDKVSDYKRGLHKEPFFINPRKPVKENDFFFIPGISPTSPSPHDPERGGNPGEYILEKPAKLPVSENVEKSNLLTFPVFTNAGKLFIDRYVMLLRKTLKGIKNGEIVA